MNSILFIALAATIAGCDNWVEVQDFATIHQQWIERHVELPNGVPSHDTFNRFFSIIDTSQFEDCFRRWAAQFNRGLADVVAIDGKSIRGCKTGPTTALHMVSAWSHNAGIAIGQVCVPAKTSELKAIPELLDALFIKDCVVTIDALAAVPVIAKKIRSCEAHYMLQVKRNRKFTYPDLVTIFQETEKDSCYSETEEGHGRIEERETCVVHRPELLREVGLWPDLASLVRVNRRSTDKRTGAIERNTAYYITSLAANAEVIAKAIRSHWGVENNLHWQLDVSFKEDACQDRCLITAQNHSLLRKIALHALSKHRTDMSVTRKRKVCAMNPGMFIEGAMGLNK